MNRTLVTRTSFAGLAAGAIACLAAGPVVAEAPTTTPFVDDFSFEATGFCTFPVTLSVHNTGTVVAFSSPSGGHEIDHITETDTFSANGQTVTGSRYHYDVLRTFDAAGNLLSARAQGVQWMFHLADGSLIQGAGQQDFLTGHVVGTGGPDFGPVCALLAG